MEENGSLPSQQLKKGWGAKLEVPLQSSWNCSKGVSMSHKTKFIIYHHRKKSKKVKQNLARRSSVDFRYSHLDYCIKSTELIWHMNTFLRSFVSKIVIYDDKSCVRSQCILKHDKLASFFVFHVLIAVIVFIIIELCCWVMIESAPSFLIRNLVRESIQSTKYKRKTDMAQFFTIQFNSKQ